MGDDCEFEIILYQVSKYNQFITFDGGRLWIRNCIKWANLINSSDLMGDDCEFEIVSSEQI